MNRPHNIECQCTACWQADSQTLPTQAYEQPSEGEGIRLPRDWPKIQMELWLHANDFIAPTISQFDHDILEHFGMARYFPNGKLPDVEQPSEGGSDG